MSRREDFQRGGREGRESDPSPHSSKIRILASAAPGSLSLALSPPRGQHPHHDARITPGRRSPPSAPRAAAPSSFASPPPPQLSGGRAGSRRAGGGGAGRAPGRPDRGRGRRRARRGGGQSRPTAATGRAGGGGGWGSLSPQFHTPRAAGRSNLSGRMSSSSPPLSSPWGSSAEALKTGGRGPSSARRAPRHLCDLAERRAAWMNVHPPLYLASPALSEVEMPELHSRQWPRDGQAGDSIQDTTLHLEHYDFGKFLQLSLK
ncbi:uncharacterized protein LOC144379875 [Halichoerus grypus]